LLRKLGVAEGEAWTDALAQPCADHGITTPRTLAAFLANTIHESAGFTRLEENLRYSPKRILQIWPKRFASMTAAQPLAWNGQALANAVYGGRMGNVAADDGWRFRGRGPLMVTGRENYARLAQITGLDLIGDPDLLLEPDIGARCAAAWWDWAKINTIAETGDITQVRRRVNGGLIGLAPVSGLFARALRLLDPNDPIAETAA
jgi:putative chitinase